MDLGYYTNFIDLHNLRRISSQIKVYFDTYDVLSCIQGIYNYYRSSDNEFDVIGFTEKEETLIHSLATLGLLGKIHLTLPHTKELIDYIERNNPDYSPEFRSKLKSFLVELIDEKDSKSFNVKKISKSSKTALKILTNMYPNHWKSRVYELLHEKELISLYNEPTEIVTEVPPNDMNIQLTILQYFESKRPERTRNNLIDTASLHFFSEMVKDVNEKLKKSEGRELIDVPVYFDRDGSLLNLLKDKPELEEYFTLYYNNPIKNISYRILLIRPASFFYCYSLYRAESSDTVIESSIQRAYSFTLPAHSRQLEDWEHQIFVEREEDLSKLDNDIKNYINYEFIISVVIPCFVESSKREFIKDLRHRYVQPHHILFEIHEDRAKSYEKHIDKAFKGAKETAESALDSYFKKYGFLYTITSRLPKLYKVLRNFDNITENSNNLFHTISLTRFFFPKEIEEKLTNDLFNFKVLRNLFDAAFIRRINTQYNNLKTTKTLDDELYEVLTLIWLTSSYSYAFDIYDKELDYPTPILMLFGANFVRDDQNRSGTNNIRQTRTERTMSVINRIRPEQFPIDTVMRITAHIAISFLGFQIISIDTQYIFSRNNDTKRNNNEIQNLKGIVFENIYKALELVERTPTENPYLLLYTTNLKIYYYTELGTDVEFESIYDILDNFIQLDKTYPSFWHYRYDDTIARFFYRRSKSIGNTHEYMQLKKELASNAFARIKKAYLATNRIFNFRDVHDIQVFKEQVDNYFASIITK